MSCNFPTDTVTLWSTNKREICGAKYKKYYRDIKDKLSENGKVFIFGDPGMGKTTIILNLKDELSKSPENIPIFVDMSSDKPFVEEFWSFIKTAGVINKLSNRIFEKRKDFGYGTFSWLKKDFSAWIASQCKKGVDNPFIRLYSINLPECNTYQELDGLIAFLEDLKKINLKPTLLIDEARAEHFYPYIHKIINSGSTWLVVASPLSVLSSIKDDATIRRIRESSVILENLTLDDAKEILSQMCDEIGQFIAEDVYESKMTIAQLIVEAKGKYQEMMHECNNDLDCVKAEVKKIGEIKDIQDKSRELEGIVRSCIEQSKEILGIDKIFNTSKRIKVSDKKYRNIDIVLISHEKVFLGDVKLTNGENLKDNSIENIKEVTVTKEHELEGKKYPLGGTFIISNGDSEDFPGEVINIPTKIIKKALREKKCTDELRRILEEKLKAVLGE